MPPAQQLSSEAYIYPKAHKDSVVENFHGTQVSDPFRWLENSDSDETKKWIEEQNSITQQYLKDVTQKESIKKRLTELWDFPKYQVPVKKGKYYFFLKNNGLQNQYVLYFQELKEKEPKVLIDPNVLDPNGTTTISSFTASENGKYLAYALSKNGSDKQEIHIRDIENNADLSEVIQHCRFTSVAFTHDNKGFYYNRYPAAGTVPKEDEHYYAKVYWHELNTSQDKDVLVYEDNSNKDLGFAPIITDDGKYLLLYIWHGTSAKNRLYYKEVKSKKPFVKLFDAEDAEYDFIYNVGKTFYIKTDLNAPKGKMIAVDLSKPEPKFFKDIITEQEDVISQAMVINKQLIVSYLKDAHHLLKVYQLNGKPVREITLPTLGTLSGISGVHNESEMFYGFTSFLYPPSVFRYDLKTNVSSIFQQPNISFNINDYQTEQVFYQSKDNTKVPMFLTYKKGLEKNGDNPTLLYGYGGFKINITPAFSVARLIWLEKGGIFVVANLRGGNEYGEEWHKKGMLENKQNVFNDFISAAEYLIENKFTNSKKLAINGGSNGGLLVAAALVQRPDLFGAAVSQVPVIDMLRYHKFTVGRYWIPEYGNAEENIEQFKYLYAYSPLHNVKTAVEYPATLVVTADHDDRVDPAHSRKFVATLQNAYSGKNPILLRFDVNAGHGGGKPTNKIIDESVDIYSFLFKALEINK